MIDTNYKTIYFKNNNQEGNDLIDALIDATNISLLKWTRKYDTVAGEYYYYGCDETENESYYFYINTKSIGSLLQIVSNGHKRVFEFDDYGYKVKLSTLANTIYKLVSKSISYDTFYNKFDYGYQIPYRDTYKEKKLEKAANKLIGVEPSRNYECL